jgi:hypothetical protein
MWAEVTEIGTMPGVCQLHISCDGDFAAMEQVLLHQQNLSSGFAETDIRSGAEIL